MSGKGIDHATCPRARVRARLWSESEKGFGDVLMRAFKKKVNVFVKVRVLDVIELENDPDKRRLFFWRDILSDKHFDYVICRPITLEPLLAARSGHRAALLDQSRKEQPPCQFGARQ